MAVIPFSRVLDYERLPIDAQDVVTKARIVIAGDVTDAVEGFFTTVSPALPTAEASPEAAYFPVPIAREYEAPEHATYGCERSFGLPKGVSPFLPPTDPLVRQAATISSFTGAASSLWDGDPTTYLTGSAWPGKPTISHPFGTNREVVGFKLVYDLDLPDSVEASTFDVSLWVSSWWVVRGSSPPVTHTFRQYARVNLPRTDLPREVVVVAPTSGVSARLTGSEAVLTLGTNLRHTFNSIRVYEFYPLVVDEDLVEGIAKAQIRLPASNPRRVTFSGTVSATDVEHTITGWPGGDYTGRVARTTYRDGTTIVDFEQAGAPLGAPQELVEAERVRHNRTRDLIQAANYPTLVGQRPVR